MINPLFADDEHKKKPQKDDGYLLPNRHGRKIHPLHNDIQPDAAEPAHHQSTIHHPLTHPKKEHTAKDGDNTNPAVALIRRKLETLYADEPDTTQEVASVTAGPAPARSKHQQFMYDLSTSGKSLAQIQTEWHNYYIHLPDAEKHQVWQEFYSNNGKQQEVPAPQTATTAVQSVTTLSALAQQPTQLESAAQTPTNPIFATTAPAEPMAVLAEELPQTTKAEDKKAKARDSRTAKAIKKQIQKRVNVSAQTQAKALQHAKSLLFGIGNGVLVLAIVLFGLFNEVVIAPFIQPSSHASATPIILSTDGVAPSATPEVIIPKINVEIPVDYSLTSNSEEEVQKGLETGVVHYPTTVKPGEQGNAAFFGHSSNNIFNPGKYKFAFVLLHELAPGDIFYLTYDSKVFTYKVYDKQIVSPDKVEVLNNVEGKTATATLITCDPPGTSLNRLVVWGEQISPDPASATTPAANDTTTTTKTPTNLTGNGPSLWKRLTGWITGD